MNNTHTNTHEKTSFLYHSQAFCLSFGNERHTRKKELSGNVLFSFFLLYSPLSSALTFIICLFVCFCFCFAEVICCSCIAVTKAIMQKKYRIHEVTLLGRPARLPVFFIRVTYSELVRSQVPSPVSSRCSYFFRNPLTLSLPSCRTSRRLKYFLHSSVALFNSLPTSVVCCFSFLQVVDKFFLPDKFSFGLL